MPISLAGIPCSRRLRRNCAAAVASSSIVGATTITGSTPSIEQWDSAYNLYHQPRTRFVADFVGQGVFLRGIAEGRDRVVTELGTLAGELPQPQAEGAAVDLLLRPDDIVHDDTSPWQAEVCAKAFRGADILYTLKLASGTRLLSLVPSHHNHALGERIGIRLEIDHVVAFPAEGA